MYLCKQTLYLSVETKPNFTYGRAEKLKSKKLFEQLFIEGKSVANFPLKLIYTKTNFKENIPFKTGVTVSKRNFKSAVKRNRIKRVLREAYRLNKSIIFNNSTGNYALLILYLGKDMPDSKEINRKMVGLLEKFKKQIGANSEDVNLTETKPKE